MTGEEFIKREFERIGGDPESLLVLDVSPYDKPTPMFSHKTTWEFRLRGRSRFVRSTIPGDCLQDGTLRMKLVAARDMLEFAERTPEGMLR